MFSYYLYPFLYYVAAFYIAFYFTTAEPVVSGSVSTEKAEVYTNVDENTDYFGVETFFNKSRMFLKPKDVIEVKNEVTNSSKMPNLLTKSSNLTTDIYNLSHSLKKEVQKSMFSSRSFKIGIQTGTHNSSIYQISSLITKPGDTESYSKQVLRKERPTEATDSENSLNVLKYTTNYEIHKYLDNYKQNSHNSAGKVFVAFADHNNRNSGSKSLKSKKSQELPKVNAFKVNFPFNINFYDTSRSWKSGNIISLLSETENKELTTVVTNETSNTPTFSVNYNTEAILKTIKRERNIEINILKELFLYLPVLFCDILLLVACWKLLLHVFQQTSESSDQKSSLNRDCYKLVSRQEDEQNPGP